MKSLAGKLTSSQQHSTGTEEKQQVLSLESKKQSVSSMCLSGLGLLREVDAMSDKPKLCIFLEKPALLRR